MIKKMYAPKPKILVIIPARGGSKGIPRKNLRALAGKPLIFYSIKNAINSRYNPDVYVSSEDDEILTVAEKIGSKVHRRSKNESKDETTLDPVIFSAVQQISKVNNCTYEIIITLQPTSPLLKEATLDSAIQRILDDQSIDTIISATDDTHLTWTKKDKIYQPNYLKRVNRQYLEPIYKETGGFLITRSECVTRENRIGEKVELFGLVAQEAVDIDSYADWSLCEFYLKRKKIVFVVSGYKEIGLGHVYNTLVVANDFLDHEVIFLVDDKSDLAYQKISSKNYTVFKQVHGNIVEDIFELNPDLVINDRLDTTESYISSLKERNYKVINFEDLGKGSKLADLTINAIYPYDPTMEGSQYHGYKYVLLRDEFILSEPIKVKRNVESILLSFGGVDPNNFTEKTLRAIHSYCLKVNIKIIVVAGLGYDNYETLSKFNDIEVFSNVYNISDYMGKADVIFTSAGRTTYEIASLAVPTIVLAQNRRELTHLFADQKNGFINMGLGYEIRADEILEKFQALVADYNIRKEMSQKMKQCNLVTGRTRVMNLIRKVIDK